MASAHDIVHMQARENAAYLHGGGSGCMHGGSHQCFSSYLARSVLSVLWWSKFNTNYCMLNNVLCMCTPIANWTLASTCTTKVKCVNQLILLGTNLRNIIMTHRFGTLSNHNNITLHALLIVPSFHIINMSVT